MVMGAITREADIMKTDLNTKARVTGTSFAKGTRTAVDSEGMKDLMSEINLIRNSSNKDHLHKWIHNNKGPNKCKAVMKRKGFNHLTTIGQMRL
jgi:hypothetical protein